MTSDGKNIGKGKWDRIKSRKTSESGGENTNEGNGN